MNIVSLRHRLQKAPFDFLTAASSSTHIHDFDKQWLSLREDVDNALHSSLLNDEDISLTHATASLVATFGQCLLEVNSEAAKTTATFVDAIEDVFSHLTISDGEALGYPSSSPTTYHRKSRTHFSTIPPYIPAAYAWILLNIHDPYPSSQAKERISQDAGRPLRAITDWFKDIRRHIGWVSLCKKHFDGSRALAVQAAKQVFLHTSSTSQLSSLPDIVHQFETVRTRLRDIYPRAEDNSDLSDSTDDSLTQSLFSSRRSPSDSPYCRSRSSSSTPSLVFSTDDEDSLSLIAQDDTPMVLGKRKTSTEDEELRILKRGRSGFISVPDNVVNNAASASHPVSEADSLPQPSSCRKRRLSVAAADWENATSSSASSPSSGVRPPLRINKRRLSVSDSQPIPKRPCLPPTVGPRKQAVSTPISIAHQATPDTNDWFHTFELPDTSLSVELFSNWDVAVENDVFPYDCLYDGSLQSDGQDPLNVISLSDAYPPSTPLELSVSSAVDPSVLDISSAFTESPDLFTILSPEPITATASPAFDFLDAFLSAVNADSAEPQSSSSPSTELSLNDTIDLFGESVVMP